jgi:transcriptional regulator with XRE-family HTH domain
MPEQSPVPLAKAVGERVRTIRGRQLGMNQTALIAELKRRGFDYEQPTISRIERGERELSVSELFAFALVLGVSPLALVTPEDPDDIVELGGEYLNVHQLRDWVRSLIPPPPGEHRRRYLNALPNDEFHALQVPGVEKLVAAVTDRLLRFLGERVRGGNYGDEALAASVKKRQTELAGETLEDIERYVSMIRDEITEGDDDGD